MVFEFSLITLKIKNQLEAVFRQLKEMNESQKEAFKKMDENQKENKHMNESLSRKIDENGRKSDTIIEFVTSIHSNMADHQVNNELRFEKISDDTSTIRKKVDDIQELNKLKFNSIMER